MFICIFVPMYLTTYLCKNVSTYTCMYVCMYLWLYVFMYVGIYVCMHACTYIFVYVVMWICINICVYTGYPRRNVSDFERVFLMLKFTDITQNTYIKSWTVTEIMDREIWNFDSCYTFIDYQIHIKTCRNIWFL